MNKYVLGVLGAIVVFGLGYGSGRYLTPAQVVVTETVKEVIQEVIVIQKEVEIKVVKVFVEKKAEEREIVETKNPDGTIVTTTKEKINTDTKIDESFDKKEKEKTEAELLAAKETAKKTETIFSKPNLRLGFQTGYNFKELLDTRTFGKGGMIFGLSVEKRLIRNLPLFVGIWANSQGAGGLGLSYEGF